MKKPFLSIIIPVFNEILRIDNLYEVISFLKKFKFDSEIIVINDGSTDFTLKKLQKMNNKNNFLIISYQDNKGKGYAIKKGMLSARGEYRLFMDIDLSTPLVELDKFIPYFSKNDVLIGTRKDSKAKLLIRQAKIRESLGKCFTWISKTTLGVKVSDFTCGFKIFSEKSALAIFNKAKINRWGFDAEIIFLSQKMGFNLKEISVVWKNDQRTKVNLLRDIASSLIELVMIRINNLAGDYT